MLNNTRPSLEVASALAYAQSDKFKARLTHALGIVEYGFEVAHAPYVACSFGKDSLVMLDLVMRVKPDVSVKFLRWSGESEHLNNYDEIIVMYQARYPQMSLQIFELNRDSLSEKHGDRWNVFDEGDSDGYFIGLRKQESRGRKITLSKHGLVYQKADGLWRICPVGDFQQRDIEAYVYYHKLPMLNAYHALGLETRTASRIPRSQVRNDALMALKSYNPTAYNALKLKFPNELF